MVVIIGSLLCHTVVAHWDKRKKIYDCEKQSISLIHITLNDGESDCFRTVGIEHSGGDLGGLGLIFL